MTLGAYAQKLEPIEIPQWFREELAILNPGCRKLVERWVRMYRPQDERAWKYHAGVIAEVKHWAGAPNPTTHTPERFFDGNAAIVHYHARELLSAEFAGAACRHVAKELVPFLLLFERIESEGAEKFFTARRQMLGQLVSRAAKEPGFLLSLCASIYTFWGHAAEFQEGELVFYFFQLLCHCLADVVRETSLRLFHSQAIPIGVNTEGQFITRAVKLRGHPRPIRLFRHLTFVLAMPRNAVVPLWGDGEDLAHEHEGEEGVFPEVTHPFTVGTEMLVNAYGNKAYTIAQPSEVMLHAGDVKSITILEARNRQCVYKVRFRDDTVSFGEIGLSDGGGGAIDCHHFSTSSIMGEVYVSPTGLLPRGKSLAEALKKSLSDTQGNEFALVAALVRDFFVCEERERYYSVERPKPRKARGEAPRVVVRYLPRFRVRYLGVRDNEYAGRKVEVIGHHVTGHLRRCRSTSPCQLVFASQFDVHVPDGFTFVRPHDRGGHTRVVYRSRSALELVYGGMERTA